MSRWQPKLWPAPKSRRTRNEHDALELGISTLVSCFEILKECYPMGGNSFERPAWAKLARDRGWMTSSRYWDLEATERVTRPGLLELMYRESPLLRMLKRPDLTTGGDA